MFYLQTICMDSFADVTRVYTKLDFIRSLQTSDALYKYRIFRLTSRIVE